MRPHFISKLVWKVILFSLVTFKYVLADTEVKSKDLLELLSGKSQVHRSLRVIQNPAYRESGSIETPRTYQGVSLKEILKSMKDTPESLQNYYAVIECSDGYQSVITSEMMSDLETGKNDAIIATRQDVKSAPEGKISSDGKWELLMMKGKLVSPGPYYIVWSNPKNSYPDGWPFQAKSLRLYRKSKGNLGVPLTK